ncbi:His-Xaa-Ser system radical SAM maturase HxsC [Puia dinghuensis]|nr:His-Xaa-Ser system radical SAM maturase HxsC [Puia dinghuensis]
MLLRTRGISINIEEPVVGRITRNAGYTGDNSILICENGLPSSRIEKFACVLTNQESTDWQGDHPVVFKVPSFEHLNEGDLVVVSQDGNIKTLYRINSFHNTLLATERCNSNCLMCSQPPRDRNDTHRLYGIYEKMIPMIPKDCFELMISGGEPTLMGELFFQLLQLIKDQLPETEVHVLTNGRSFAWNNLAEKLSDLEYNRLMLGIPVYADYYQMHDYIVQAKDAFNQTILGIHNLARYDQRIEIRVVLHQQSIPRLTRLSRYIYKNMPFVEHITFMGLEYIGYTPYNIDKLWIDPHDYMDELGEAVEFLSGQGMNVSIYNSQLCVLPEALWKYAKKSISDWKQSYLPECERCNKLSDCGGLFTWNLKKHSEHIRPFA